MSLHTARPMPAGRRKNSRLARMAAQLISEPGRGRGCRQPQAVQKPAALRQADVEQVARATIDRCLRIDEARERFIEHDRHADFVPHFGERGNFLMRHRLLDATDPEFQQRLNLCNYCR